MTLRCWLSSNGKVQTQIPREAIHTPPPTKRCNTRQNAHSCACQCCTAQRSCFHCQKHQLITTHGVAATATSHSTSRQCGSHWVSGESVRPAAHVPRHNTHSMRAIACWGGQNAAHTRWEPSYTWVLLRQAKNPHRESAKLAPVVQVLTPSCPIANTQETVHPKWKGDVAALLMPRYQGLRNPLTAQHTKKSEG
jgi:hypothetical protein